MRNEPAKEDFGMKNEKIKGVAMSCAGFFHP
jgi:hypothetical protein